MALINCPECNNQVSDTALTCPHCGYQLKKPKVKPPITTVKKKPKRGCGVVIITLAVVAIIAIIIHFTDQNKPTVTPTPAPPVVSQYVKQYAGGYTIEVKGYSGSDVEAYALRDDGTATWLWIEPDGKGGAVTKQRKTGTWNATASTITTKINGNTGVIVENYTLQNGVFVSTTNSNTYLKANK